MAWTKPICRHGKPTKWLWTVWHPEGFVLGDKVDIGAGCHIFCQAGVEIQDNVQIGGGCYIYSKSTIDDKEGQVAILEGARIGAMTMIMPGVTIGKNALVGAHSFVNRDIPDGKLACGVPAKVRGNAKG